MESRSRTGAAATVLGACLALGGCTEPGETGTATDTATDAVAPTLPGSDDPVAGPNFAFAVGEAHRSDPATSAASVARLEAFYEGVLAPLQRLPGLMPRTVSVVYDRCGTANAFHDAATDTVTLCHELEEYARELASRGTDPDSDDPDTDAAVVELRTRSSMAFVLYHEIAHALDAQLSLPIAGNIESAMDAIATVISVETGQPQFPVNGAGLFAEQPPSLAGQHGGGLDRGGDIACWTVGGDALAQSQLVDPAITDVFAASDRDCVAEYLGQRDTVRAWVPGLGRLGEAPSGPGTIAADAAPTFRFVPGPAWSRAGGSDPATRRRVERLFDGILAPLNDAVSGLSEPVDAVYDLCGAPTSSYDAASRTVTLCEELVEHAYRIEVDLIGASTTAQLAGALQTAYDFLGFALYREVAHVLDASGRLPPVEDVESAGDAIAAVLLAGAGRGRSIFDAMLFLLAQPPEQAALHGPVGDRADDLFCLALGGDPILRADPVWTDETLARYVTGERDCVAEYAERREAVRGWLSPAR